LFDKFSFCDLLVKPSNMYYMSSASATHSS